MSKTGLSSLVGILLTVVAFPRYFYIYVCR